MQHCNLALKAFQLLWTVPVVLRLFKTSVSEDTEPSEPPKTPEPILLSEVP